MLATKQSLPHTPGTYGQQQSSRRHERPSTSTGRTTPPSLAILPTRPIRVRPTQSEHSGQRIDACERLSPLRSNSSRDDENHPISGMLGGSNCTAVRGNEGYSASVKGECGFRRCNRRLSSTTLFNSPEVALANELSPELLSLDGVAFFEICNGGVVSRASVE